MMPLTREQVRANRQKWINHLLLPTTKKTKRVLEDIDNNEERCCLGHASHVLGLNRSVDAYTRDVFYECESDTLPNKGCFLLGMRSAIGFVKDPSQKLRWEGYEAQSLAEMNDRLDLTPQEIGKYLQSVIEGGGNTPFNPLSDYPMDS